MRLKKPLILLVLAASLAGCSSASVPTASPTTTPSAPVAASASPATAAKTLAADGALTALAKFHDYVYMAETTGTFDEAAMTAFTGQPLLAITLEGFNSNKQAGVIMKGPKPISTPTVHSVDLTSTPAKVVIYDCYDDSGLVPLVDGKPLPVSGARRAENEIDAVGTGADWHIVSAIHKASSC